MLYTPSWKAVANEKVGLPKAAWDGYMGEECAHATRQWDFVTKDGDFGKAGYHGQTLYVSPSKNLVVASFATGEKYDTFTFARAIRKSLK